MEQIGQPFVLPAEVLPAVAAARSSIPVPVLLFSVWFCGFAISAAVWFRWWRRFRAALRAATPLDLDLPVPVMTSPHSLEPGVFGIRKPVLLLPAGIGHRLTPDQLQSIVAHELCHVRRRDNLAAAIHMVVESVFWFHPLVWWIGARLVEERERACDEEVVRQGTEPHVYAEGILNVCKFYLQSPLACASGVTGADLKKRIEAIVNRRISNRLTLDRKLLLIAAGIAAVAGPVLMGIINAPRGLAQVSGPKFDVASIKPHKNVSNEVHRTVDLYPGGRLAGRDATVQQLIQHAYNVKPFQISSGPGWVFSDGYDIEAKAEGNPSREQMRLMLRTLLEKRFQLKLRSETKSMGAYELTVTKGGARLMPPKPESCAEPGKNTASEQGAASLPPCGRAWLKGDRSLVEIAGFSLTMRDFTSALSNALGSIVFDKTGLTQKFDVRLEFSPEGLNTGKPGVLDSAPSEPATTPLFLALERELGLKIESAKGPVEVLIVEHAERPSAN
jgi:uncharacterized protein (TIGR03435 family)